jgi:hypothetical protein
MHNRAGRKLRRNDLRTAWRCSPNQLASLMTHERIQTTHLRRPRSCAPRRAAHHAAKNDGVAARAGCTQWIPDRTTGQEGLRDDRPPLRRPARRLHADPAPRRAPRGQRRSRHPGVRGLPLRARKDKAPRKESLSERARRATGGRVRNRAQEEGGGRGRGAGRGGPEEGAASGQPPRGGKGLEASKQGPAKGPSRTGPSSAEREVVDSRQSTAVNNGPGPPLPPGRGWGGEGVTESRGSRRPTQSRREARSDRGDRLGRVSVRAQLVAEPAAPVARRQDSQRGQGRSFRCLRSRGASALPCRAVGRGEAAVLAGAGARDRGARWRSGEVRGRGPPDVDSRAGHGWVATVAADVAGAAVWGRWRLRRGRGVRGGKPAFR